MLTAGDFHYIMELAIITLFLLGCGFWTLGDAAVSYPQVNTTLGILEGTYNTTKNGRQYESYIGVPFAEAPTGELRFQTANNISAWSGVRMAKEFAPLCIQYDFTATNASEAVIGSEDCLYLNIYTPSENRTTLLPVIAFIPGGGFQVEDANEYGPKYLLDRDVILVTVKYRVGPMGFLSTEDATVSGNAGLKDIVMALRWIKNNIKAFGGNSSSVTVAGQSAGAIAAHYLYLTNLTTGLFQGGISMSGVATASWGLQKYPLEKAKMLAATVGCSTENTTAMVNCLQALPAKDLVQSVSAFMTWPLSPTTAFTPSIEKGGSEFTFIDRSPIEIITCGDTQKVPWLTSIVSDEALFPYAYYETNTELLAALDANWTSAAPFVLNYNDTIADEDKAEVASLIKTHYFGESSINRTTLRQTMKMITDEGYAAPIANATKLQANSSKSAIYTYYFTYRGNHSVSELLTGTNENLGVCHGDDMFYILDIYGLDPTTTSEDLAMQKVLLDLWESFATNRKPKVGVTWPKLSRSLKKAYNHLYIAGPQNMTMRNTSNFGDDKFWQSINVH